MLHKYNDETLKEFDFSEEYYTYVKATVGIGLAVICVLCGCFIEMVAFSPAPVPYNTSVVQQVR